MAIKLTSELEIADFTKNESRRKNFKPNHSVYLEVNGTIIYECDTEEEAEKCIRILKAACDERKGNN